MPAAAAALGFETGRRWTARIGPDGVALDACRFEAGYRSFADGSIDRFTGRSPEPALALEPPPVRLDEEALAARLDELRRHFGGRVDLRYTHLDAARLVVAADGEQHRKAVSSWALLGGLTTAGGRRVPVGWSGAGDGLARLADPALRARYDWLAAALDRAEPLPSGSPAVVLSPQAAALLLHESVGHFAEGPVDEADLGHRLGLRVASEGFTVADDPTASDGLARYAVDDDAVEAFAPTEVVRDGVLVAQLHSRASARRARALPTGNGRAALWAPPIPRMSNLRCGTGACSEAELVDRLGEGLFVHQFADGLGFGLNVEARVVLAERVERGRRTGRFLTGGRMKEQVGVLSRLVGLGAERVVSPNGLCGKAGQLLFDVGMAAPAMQLSRLDLVG